MTKRILAYLRGIENPAKTEYVFIWRDGVEYGGTKAEASKCQNSDTVEALQCQSSDTGISHGVALDAVVLECQYYGVSGMAFNLSGGYVATFVGLHCGIKRMVKSDNDNRVIVESYYGNCVSRMMVIV